jgi:multidrug efflux pump subunit AcrA (membrane-fusion protein)
VSRNGIAVTGILVSTLLVSGCGGGPDRSITKAPVGFGAVTEVVEAPATITPKSEITVSAAADGKIAGLMVQDGQQVAAGQPLLRIDSPAAQAQLAQAKAADAQAAASASNNSGFSGIDFTNTEATTDANAKKAFDAATATANQIADATIKQGILARIASAQTDYETASADVRSTIRNFNNGLASASDVFGSLATAQRTQTSAAAAIAQKTVDALTVAAPTSGLISLRSGTGSSGASGVDVSGLLGQLAGSGLGSQVAGLAGAAAGGSGSGVGGGSSSSTDTAISVGSPVSSGAPLLVITDASVLSVTAQVDETSILKVAKGITANVQLDAIPDAVYEATVTSVDFEAQQSSRGGVSYRVRLSLSAGTLGDGSTAPVPRPGMSAVADLKVASADHVLAVPSASVVHVGTQDTVWLVTKGVAHRQVVRLGAQGDTVVEVASGLSLGDTVVTAGADKVHDGEKL